MLSIVGYPFGGLLYALAGKSPPFVGIALLCMLNIGNCSLQKCQNTCYLSPGKTMSTSVPSTKKQHYT